MIKQRWVRFGEKGSEGIQQIGQKNSNVSPLCSDQEGEIVVDTKYVTIRRDIYIIIIKNRGEKNSEFFECVFGRSGLRGLQILVRKYQVMAFFGLKKTFLKNTIKLENDILSEKLICHECHRKIN